MVIARGKEEQIRKYKDRKGNNVLHVLLSYFTKIHVDWKGLVASVQLLLNLGVDAADKNNAQETTLEKFLSSAVTCDLFAEMNSSSDEPYGIAREDALTECGRLLVPHFKGIKQNNPKLLLHLNALSDITVTDHGRIKWIELYQLIVDNDVLPISFVLYNGLSNA